MRALNSLKIRHSYSLQFLRNSSKISSSSTKEEKYVKGVPTLPVPQMHRTLMHNYLMSVRPFLNCEEFCNTEGVVRSFASPGGLGEKLHDMLLKKAVKEENWLKDWWLNSAYLEFRAPVVIFSSPGEIFPNQKFHSLEEMLCAAAKGVTAALEFKKVVDEKKFPQEMMGGAPLDMVQYERIFGTHRIPICKRDKLVYHPESKHIVVMANGHPFKIQVGTGECWLETGKILQQLESVVEAAKTPAEDPVGVLSSDTRDNWANAYHLLCLDSRNKKSLSEIEKALFVVCLDLKGGQRSTDDMSAGALACIHGGGPSYNGGNRWFDKTIQLVFSIDGSCGICYEHSPAEGGPIAVLTDHIVESLNKPLEKSKQVLDNEFHPEKLCFNVSSDVKNAIMQAETNFTKLVNDLDVACFSFSDFGKECLKTLKVSPDSFIQLGIQYAFYRLHGEPGAQYESGSLRKFKEGRTETIRTCSSEAIRAIKAMLDGHMPIQSKANALRLAINHHKDLTMAALNALGVDRYLFALKMLAKECNMKVPEIFIDPAYVRSTNFRLSTSQVPSKTDCFMCYGPITTDGYGCCYNPRPNNINFGTSSYNSCPSTSAAEFKDFLSGSLNDMKDILEKSPQSKL